MTPEWLIAGIAVLALIVTAAAVWLLEGPRDLDRHIDQALTLANARDRHPASRRVCGICGCGVIGPMPEHICEVRA